MEQEDRRQWRVVVVDDHEVVRLGLVALLGRCPDFTVVAEAATVAGAVAKAREHRPDIVVMDLRLPDGSGLDACRTIHELQPDVRVIVLTSWPDAGGVHAAIESGASGYLLKTARARDLIASIEAVVRGETLRDPDVEARVAEGVRRVVQRERSHGLETLTPQELRTLDLLADGLSNRAIAQSMHLSDKTVKNYVSTVLGKLRLQRRTQAAAFMAHRAERWS